MERQYMEGDYIELSEHKAYLELTNLVCCYDDMNRNGRLIPYGKNKKEQDATLAMAQTLVDMPVYAKVVKNRKGEDTFRGHEARQLPTGEWEFDTIPIGVHTGVSIKNHEVVTSTGESKTLPCLFATARIWKRNKRACAAAKRLFTEGNLHNSWEIETLAYEYKSGVKILKDYVFVGNCFLANDAAGAAHIKPAYACARVLDLSQKEEYSPELMVAEALYFDGLDQDENEVNEMDKENKNGVADTGLDTSETGAVETPTTPANPDVDTSSDGVEQEAEQQEESAPEQSEGGAPASDEPAAEQSGAQPEQGEENQPETSALTTQDLYGKLRHAQELELINGYIAHVFPLEKEAWMHPYNGTDTEVVVLKFEVDGDDVKIVSQTPMVLTVSPREAEKKIVEQQQIIQTLQTETSELAELKKEVEKYRLEKAETEKKQTREKMTAAIKKCGLFDETEIASAPVSELLDSADEKGLKLLIADKLLAQKADVETSSTEASVELPTANLNNTEVSLAAQLSAALRNISQ